MTCYVAVPQNLCNNGKACYLVFAALASQPFFVPGYEMLVLIERN